jgi:hypothetical protein
MLLTTSRIFHQTPHVHHSTRNHEGSHKWRMQLAIQANQNTAHEPYYRKQETGERLTAYRFWLPPTLEQQRAGQSGRQTRAGCLRLRKQGRTMRADPKLEA